MAKVLPLSDSKIKSLKSQVKEYKVADGDGLYLHVTPTGNKVWKVRYAVAAGKTSTYTIGKYPAISLANARAKKSEIKHKVDDGIKPTTLDLEKSGQMTFSALCDEYFSHNDHLSEKYIENNKGYLKNHYYLTMEKLLLDEIEPEHIIRAVEMMQKKGIGETVRRTGSLLDRIFKYAVTKRKMKRNPMGDIDLSVIVKKHKKENFAHITDVDKFKELLLSIEDYWGDVYTKAALRLMPYVFVRPANIRGMLWSEIDFERKMWTIPAEKMKMRRDHIVPLTDSMIKIIKTVENNGSEYVFPAPTSRKRMMSENTLNMALKRMGYKDVMTSHGFRHTASTLLHENMHLHGIPSEVIEIQLAHVEKNAIKGTYNKALYMDQRTKLMQWWSDYLDSMKI